jgi:hypothetical protein
MMTRQRLGAVVRRVLQLRVVQPVRRVPLARRVPLVLAARPALGREVYPPSQVREGVARVRQARAARALEGPRRTRERMPPTRVTPRNITRGNIR